MIYSFERFNEKKDNWIKGAIGEKGALRKSLKKEEGENITLSEINKELKKLKAKDKDKSKPGTQGLSKSDLKKFRQLNLAKVLLKTKNIKESKHDTENYMFFANLEHIVRMASEIIEMDDSMVDEILKDGHDWANDHISKSMESIQHVYNFLMYEDGNSGYDEYPEDINEKYRRFKNRNR